MYDLYELLLVTRGKSHPGDVKLGLILREGGLRRPEDGRADLVVRNAKVSTLQVDGEEAEAFAVRGEQFVAVGDETDVINALSFKITVSRSQDWCPIR